MRAHRSALLAAAFLSAAAPASALPPDEAPRRVASEVLPALRSAGAHEPVRVARFPVGEGLEADLELASFRVWAPGARIVLRDGKGERDMPVPDVTYLRGKVSGRPDSLVVLAAGDVLRGFVFLDGRVLTVAPERDVYRGARKGDPSFVRSVDLESEMPDSFRGFRCSEPPEPPAEEARDALAAPAAPLSTTMYTANVAVETDYELYAILGSSSALTTYVGDLFAAGSAIYQRDVQTQLQVSYLSIWSGGAGSDPWAAASTSNALMEFGDYWHANRTGITRTTAHFLSGKNMGGGIAWIGALCRTDFLCSSGSCGSAAYDGHWGGGYGVSAIDGVFSTTNPSLYWDLLCSTHELGHNFNSPHTHCYTPTPVDTCCSCAAGTCTGSVPPEKGTIMSYCHLRPGGYNNIKLYFGVVGESSEPVLTRMRTYVEGRSHTAACMPEAGAAAASLYTVTPCRVLDTRNANGALGGPILAGGGAQRSFTVTGACGIPSGATSVSTNVTVTSPSAAGELRLFPAGGSAPTSTVISFPAGTTRANNAHVYLSTGGAFTVQSDGGATHFILDVNGYYQ